MPSIGRSWSTSAEVISFKPPRNISRLPNEKAAAVPRRRLPRGAAAGGLWTGARAQGNAFAGRRRQGWLAVAGGRPPAGGSATGAADRAGHARRLAAPADGEHQGHP